MAGGITYPYSTLVTDLQANLEDDSAEFVAEIPNIINRAELRCVRDLDLNVFNTRTEANLTGSSATQTKPTDSLIVDSIFLVASRTHLLRRSVDFISAFDNGVEGTPKYFGENDADDTDVRLSPTPSSALAVVWWTYARPDRLVLTSNETNWLTDKVGDLLYRACVVESCVFLGWPEQLAIEESAYKVILGQSIWEFRLNSRRDGKALEAAARVARK